MEAAELTGRIAPAALPPEPVLARLRRHAAEAYPQECCGIAVGADVHVSRNVHPSPGHGFRLDAASQLLLARALREGRPGDVVLFHSHPDGGAELSADDVAGAYLDGELRHRGLVHVVIAVAGGVAGEVRAFAAT